MEYISKSYLVKKFNELADKYDDENNRQRGLAYATAADIIASMDSANVFDVDDIICLRESIIEWKGAVTGHYSIDDEMAEYYDGFSDGVDSAISAIDDMFGDLYEQD